MCTVMVIDDNQDVRELISAAVVSQGHKVVAAASMAAALETIKVSTPDVVTVDLELPEGNGMEALRQLRGAGMTSFAVVVSAHRKEYSKALTEEWKNLRIFDVMEKPFRVDVLLRRLEDAAEATQKESQLCQVLDKYLEPAVD